MLENASVENLSGETILFMSLPRHDAKYTSTPWQLAVQLAQNNRVFFADNPFTFFEILKGSNKAVRQRMKGYASMPSFEKDGVTVINAPFVIPINFLPRGPVYNFFSTLNHKIVAARINKVLSDNKVSSVIFVNSFNFYFNRLSKYLKPKKALSIYHCIDPMVKGFTLKHGPYLQDDAARKSDATISTAPALQQNFLRMKISNSYLVPNAANYRLFASVPLLAESHPKVKTIPGKVIGYFGNIERRTDFSLLRTLVNALPDWHLVLAGPYDKSFVPPEFFHHDRIHLTGPFTHDEAPAVIKRFDVAIIPFQLDDVSNGIYPLKLFEYLAAGKPVVTTNFNTDILKDLTGVIHVADSHDDFVKQVLLAYATDSSDKMKERQTLSSHHTWEDRAKQFGDIIQNELKRKAMTTTQKNAISNQASLKEKIKSNPRLKKLILWLIFRRKPNGSRVMWYIWLWLIFPKYFRAGVNWGSRLDLTPFNKFFLGKFSRVEQGVVINNGMGDVIIHDEVHTGIGCVIIGPVTLHKHVGLSQYVRILGMHHGSDPLSPHHHQPTSRAPVILEEDAFIGTGTVIMGKKTGEPLVLGRYCRVGANSVVTTDIPPYSVAVGNPAKVVRVWDFKNNCWVKPGSVKEENLRPVVNGSKPDHASALLHGNISTLK
jgi:teichuronic acid biosynthesis glycosyltransferase TuaH